MSLPTEATTTRLGRRQWDDERAVLANEILNALDAERTASRANVVHSKLNEAWNAGSLDGWSAHGGLVPDEEHTVCVLLEDLVGRLCWWELLPWQLSARFRLWRMRRELRFQGAGSLASKLTLEDLAE